MEFSYQAIGILHSCFKEKFGIPRQAGLVPDARGTLELYPPFNRRAYLEGLEGFSHLWLQYVFHAASMGQDKSTVRPPRLGGNRRLGVFGTRSNFRPNPIGLSLVRLEGIAYENGGVRLDLAGIDMLDQTPVLDIKPYIPYADCRPEAVGGFAPHPPKAVLQVRFALRVRATLQGMPPLVRRQWARLLVQVLRLDPRPAYYGTQGKKKDFGFQLLDRNVRWRVAGATATVTRLEDPLPGGP
jgi:tRNA-Thr(GGU) m(6)t(6)A37 methyltransferase TsaA